MMKIFTINEAQVARNATIIDMDQALGDLGRRTATGGLIAIGSQLARLVLQLVQAALLSRLLVAEDFGLIAMAMTITAFVGIFTDLGLSAATIQRKEIDQDTVSGLFFLGLAVSTLMMLLCFALAPFAVLIFPDDRVPWALMGMAATIPLSALASQHGALLARNMRWVATQWTATASQAAGVAAGLLLAWQTDLGYWSIVVSSWTAGICGVLFTWYACRWRPTWPRTWNGVKANINFGANLTGVYLMNYFHKQLDNVLVGSRWGAAELGYYSRAYTLLTLPLNLINGPVGTVIVPALSRVQNDPQRWRRTYLDSLGFVTMIGSLLAAGSISVAEPLVRLLFGSGWDETAFIFLFLAISMFAAIPMNTAGWIFMSLGRTDRMFRWACVATPLVATSFIVGLPYGAKGVAIGYSIINCILFLPAFAYATRRSPVSLKDCLSLTVPFVFCGAAAALVGRHFGATSSSSNAFRDVLFASAVTATCFAVTIGVLALVHTGVRDLLLKLAGIAARLLPQRKLSI